MNSEPAAANDRSAAIGDKGLASLVFGAMFLLAVIVVPLALWADSNDTIYWIFGAGAFLAVLILLMNLNVSYERKSHVINHHIYQHGRYNHAAQQVINGQVVPDYYPQPYPPQVPYTTYAPHHPPQVPHHPTVQPVHGQTLADLTAQSYQKTKQALPKPLSYAEARERWK